MPGTSKFINLSVCIALAAPLGTLASCEQPGGGATATPAAEVVDTRTQGLTYTVSYKLGTYSTLMKLYPDFTWVPAPVYTDYYRALLKTIYSFTASSLQRDNIAYSNLNVSPSPGLGLIIVSFDTSDPSAAAYASVHPNFFNSAHAGQALVGVNYCKSVGGCWDNSNPMPNSQPWSMFLPLGLAMVNQPVLLFLDYPPAISLMQKDYLNNFTMQRWNRVNASAGALNSNLYSTIVDSRPIGAPGSGQTSTLPNATTYFNSPSGPGGYYLNPMLQLLSDTPNNTNPDHTAPIVALGTPARETWGKIINYQGTGATPPVPSVGTFAFPGASKKTAWIATNHPDVTTYNCCAQDSYCGPIAPPAQWCGGSNGLGQYPSNMLYQCEQLDLTVSCWEVAMGQNHSQDPQVVWNSCYNQWFSPNSNNAHQICINAKLDNNNPQARCSNYKAADNYCYAHSDNPCATLDCN